MYDNVLHYMYGALPFTRRNKLNQKIERILKDKLVRWERMSRDALINELYEEKMYFLETELEQGNEEYLDELIADIEEDAK